MAKTPKILFPSLLFSLPSISISLSLSLSLSLFLSSSTSPLNASETASSFSTSIEKAETSTKTKISNYNAIDANVDITRRSALKTAELKFYQTELSTLIDATPDHSADHSDPTQHRRTIK